MSFDDLDFCILCDEDYDAVIDFVIKNFINSEVLSSALRMNPEEGRIYYVPLLKNTLWQKVSIGAYKKDTEELVAISISLLGKNQQSTPPAEKMEPLKIRQFNEINRYFLGGSTEKAIGTEEYFRSFILSTREDYRQRGIATEFYKKSIVLARKEKCKKLFTLATSAYTLKMTDNLGFKRGKDLVHGEYVDLLTGEKILRSIEAPHTKTVLVVKTL